MLLFQWVAGILIALAVWNICKFTFQTLFWLLGLLFFIGIITPVLLLLIGSFTFLGVGLLGTLGLLLLISAWFDAPR